MNLFVYIANLFIFLKLIEAVIESILGIGGTILTTFVIKGEAFCDAFDFVIKGFSRLPKNQGNREARSAIYATAAVPIFDHVFIALPGGVPVSNCFNGLLRTLTKNSLEDRMSKFHLVKKWWDFENRDYGV